MKQEALARRKYREKNEQREKMIEVLKVINAKNYIIEEKIAKGRIENRKQMEDITATRNQNKEELTSQTKATIYEC